MFLYFVRVRYLIMIRQTFTSENCLYWIKAEGFENWKLAIYNDEKKEFRLIQITPEKETEVFKKDKCQYMVNMSLRTKLP